MSIAPEAKHRVGTNSRHTRRSLSALSGLLLLLFALTGAALFRIAFQQNHHAVEQTRFYLGKALEAREASLLLAVSDYAFWGDAYRNLHAELNIDWAYVRQNMGPSLYEDFGYEGLFVTDPFDRTVYSVIDGGLTNLSATEWLALDLRELLAQARSGAEDEEPVAQLVVVKGQPAFIAAAALTTGGDASQTEKPGPASVLLFVDRLTAQKLQELGENYGLANLRATRGDASSATAGAVMTLPTSDNDPIYLRWDPATPGNELLKILLPLLVFSGVVLALLARLIISRANTAAREMDHSYNSLSYSQTALANSEARFRDVAEAASDWIWETDAQLRLTYLSERFQQVTGFAPNVWLGRPINEFLPQIDDLGGLLNSASPADPSDSRQCFYTDQSGRQRICRLSLRAIRNSEGLVGFRGTANDITDEIETRARFEHLSQHDALTGLPNRNRMQEFLTVKLNAKPTVEHPLVLMSLDLDRFKPVNDSFGHETGDRVLNEVSERLRQCMREGDLVARLGGDEFILIVNNMSSRVEIERLCERLITSIQQPFTSGNHLIFISASIGVTLAPADATRAVDLLRCADIALYEAKGAGRKTWCFYANDMNTRLTERRRLENDLRIAVKEEQLSIVLQPRYCLQTGRIISAEALVRWLHPALGLLGPESFIPIAEQTGQISALSSWVMHQACHEACSWSQEINVSVNLSPLEFQRGELAKQVRRVLDSTRLSPARLELELPESVLIQDAEGALATMRALKQLGVRLSMDDFGTGYSSLSYLRAFPFDGLKIDHCLVNSLENSEPDQAIVKAIISISKALSLTVTAEGVETEQQLLLVKELGCDDAQGYLLDRPLLPQQMRSVLAGAKDQPNET